LVNLIALRAMEVKYAKGIRHPITGDVGKQLKPTAVVRSNSPIENVITAVSSNQLTVDINRSIGKKDRSYIQTAETDQLGDNFRGEVAVERITPLVSIADMNTTPAPEISFDDGREIVYEKVDITKMKSVDVNLFRNIRQQHRVCVVEHVATRGLLDVAARYARHPVTKCSHECNSVIDRHVHTTVDMNGTVFNVYLIGPRPRDVDHVLTGVLNDCRQDLVESDSVSIYNAGTGNKSATFNISVVCCVDQNFMRALLHLRRCESSTLPDFHATYHLAPNGDIIGADRRISWTDNSFKWFMVDMSRKRRNGGYLWRLTHEDIISAYWVFCSPDAREEAHGQGLLGYLPITMSTIGHSVTILIYIGKSRMTPNELRG